MPKATTASTVSGALATERTTSTSGCTGAGLKKCMPTTCWGRCVAVARSMMAMEEVLEASTACGGVMVSSSPKMRRFSSRFSMTASMTRSQPARSARSWEYDRLAAAASWASAVMRPRACALPSEVPMRCCTCSTAAASISVTVVWTPLRAHTSAMPEPIVPPPTTPTF